MTRSTLATRRNSPEKARSHLLYGLWLCPRAHPGSNPCRYDHCQLRCHVPVRPLVVAAGLPRNNAIGAAIDRVGSHRCPSPAFASSTYFPSLFGASSIAARKGSMPSSVRGGHCLRRCDIECFRSRPGPAHVIDIGIAAREPAFPERRGARAICAFAYPQRRQQRNPRLELFCHWLQAQYAQFALHANEPTCLQQQ